MHQIHYSHCICCSKSFQSWELRHKATMRCPMSNDWRRVIDSKMPFTNTPEEASEVSDALNNLGVMSDGSHSYYHDDKVNTEDRYVVHVSLIQDILEELMKHTAYEGAKYHPDEIVCEECAKEMRKKLYNGEVETPDIRCPICETVLVPFE